MALQHAGPQWDVEGRHPSHGTGIVAPRYHRVPGHSADVLDCQPATLHGRVALRNAVSPRCAMRRRHLQPGCRLPEHTPPASSRTQPASSRSALVERAGGSSRVPRGAVLDRPIVPGRARAVGEKPSPGALVRSGHETDRCRGGFGVSNAKRIRRVFSMSGHTDDWGLHRIRRRGRRRRLAESLGWIVKHRSSIAPVRDAGQIMDGAL